MFVGIQQNSVPIEISNGRSPSSSSVQFMNPNLEKEIASILGKSENEDITIKEMETLTTLDLSNKNILDLSGLETASNLIELNLEYNNISSIDPLANLSNLEILNLNANKVKNTSSLKNGASIVLWTHLS